MKKTAVAIVLVLGLGTGGALGLFSLLDAIALQQLPVPRPDELIAAKPLGLPPEWDLPFPSSAAFGRLATLPGLFTAAAGIGSIAYLGGSPGSDGRFWTTVDGVTGGYYDVLGIRPQAGRLLRPADIAGSARVAVASAQFWERRLGANPHAVGSIFTLQGVTLTIVGITPPSYRGLEAGAPTDLTVPLGLLPVLSYTARPDEPFISWLVGRRAPGVTTAQVAAALQAAWPAARTAGLPAWFKPGTVKLFTDSRIETVSAATGMSSFARSEYSRVLWLLVVAGILVVGLACVNVSTLLLAQSVAREREFGIRAALGASPARLVQQVLGQALWLAAAGTAVGVPIAVASAHALSAVLFLYTAAAAAPFDFTPDRYVIAAIAATAVTCALIVVVLPAVRATRSDLMRSVRSAAGAAARTRRWGHRLLVGQVAAATVLLVAGWIVTTNLERLISRPGFSPVGVTFVSLDQRPGAYPAHFDIQAHHRRLVEAVAAIPGVQGVGLMNGGLFAGSDQVNHLALSIPGAAASRDAMALPMGPGTLGAFEVPLLQGRDFNWADDDTHPRVGILSATLARALFGSDRALGRHLRAGDRGEEVDLEVIGVAADARVVDLRTADNPVIYIPIAQQPGHARPSPEVVVRAHLPLTAWFPEVRSRIQAMGQDDVVQTRTLSEIMRERLLRERLVAIGGSYFAGLAGLIMALGLGGLMAYSVSCRTREIGIRSAIGASAAAIRWLVVREAMTTVVAGLAIGLVLAGALASIAGHTIPMGSLAPVAFTGGALLTIVIGLAAAWLPARRATVVDPLHALRSE